MFATAIGQRVQLQRPDLVTFERTISKRRRGTVLLDALQNARGKPLAAPYSVRPVAGASVSCPVDPKELANKVVPQKLNTTAVFSRLQRCGDLWRDFWKSLQRLEDAVNRAI